MAAGLQLFDEAGRLVVDNTTSLGRVIGSINITTTHYDPNNNPSTSNQTGSVTVEQFRYGKPFFFTVSAIDTYSQYLYPEPEVTIGENYISWSRGLIGAGTNVATTTRGYFNGTLFYGVY